MPTKTYKPIATTTLSTTQTTITFSSIPSTYTDIVLVISGRGTRTSAAIVDGFIRFNNDSGSNYSTTHLYGDGSSAGSDRATNKTEAYMGYWFPTANTTSGIFSATTIHIQNYSNATTYKTLMSKDGNLSNTNGLPGTSVSLWRSTSAINRVDLFLSPNDWATGSTFTLYGIL